MMNTAFPSMRSSRSITSTRPFDSSPAPDALDPDSSAAKNCAIVLCLIRVPFSLSQFPFVLRMFPAGSVLSSVPSSTDFLVKRTINVVGGVGRPMADALALNTEEELQDSLPFSLTVLYSPTVITVSLF
ncbi:hypothetical protein MSAN_01626900 [Mycena sanguinolenta]|uniref:Uncharacterized protein n=1 Tax=Mycena sanguinolenta TaxID=230812 RepID=A0A8H7CU87_9AGAR|nr:hypothetical protein MSAN_01626900 [Mycena sanguinolenta]